MRLIALLPVLLFAFALFSVPAQAQTASVTDHTFDYLSAAIAFATSALAAGWAISKAGSAGLAGSAEKPEIRTTAIIISALGEALAIYGIVVALLILGKVGSI